MKKLIVAAILALAALPALAQGTTIIGRNSSGGYVGPLELFQPSGSGTYAGRTAPKGQVLYDSGVVASGAAISSGVLDLTGINTVSIIVDNTAGTVVRNLSMVTYLGDGSTQVDSVQLRKVMFGAAPVGGEFAPGMARGLVGLGASLPPSMDAILIDTTSGSAAAMDTGPIFTEDCDALWIPAVASANTTQMVGKEVSDDGVVTTITGGGTASGVNSVVMGVGAVGAQGSGGVTSYLPRRMQFTTTAATAGTVRLRAICRGRPPGTFALPIMLPTKAAFNLASGGSANGRLTIIGR